LPSTNTIPYGSKPNSDLLTHYGFVPSGNSHDYASVLLSPMQQFHPRDVDGANSDGRGEEERGDDKVELLRWLGVELDSRGRVLVRVPYSAWPQTLPPDAWAYARVSCMSMDDLDLALTHVRLEHSDECGQGGDSGSGSDCEDAGLEGSLLFRLEGDADERDGPGAALVLSLAREPKAGTAERGAALAFVCACVDAAAGQCKGAHLLAEQSGDVNSTLADGEPDWCALYRISRLERLAWASQALAGMA
jgi:hypothetical protein